MSVDPVSASSVNGGNFNRYWYANNNPYKFTDPDGRFIQEKWRHFGGTSGGFNGKPPRWDDAFQLDAGDRGSDRSGGESESQEMQDHVSGRNGPDAAGGIGEAIIKDAGRGIENMLDDAAVDIKCVAVCGVKEYIGESVGEALANGYTEVGLSAVGKGVAESGLKLSAKAVSAAGNVLLVKDTAGFLMCTSQKCISPEE